MRLQERVGRLGLDKISLGDMSVCIRRKPFIR